MDHGCTLIKFSYDIKLGGQLIPSRAGLPFGGTYMGWRNGPTETSCHSTRTNVESCAQEGKSLAARGLSAEKDPWLTSDSKPKSSQQRALAAERATSTLGGINRSPANRPREVIIPHRPALVDPH